MIIDPQSHSYRDWRYVGRRYFASKKRLKEEKMWDFEKQKEVKRFKNLSEVQPSGSITDYESDKVKKDQAIGATAPGDGDIIECVEIWTRSKVVVIANRNTIIEERENPYYRLEKAHFERQKAEFELDMLEYEQNLANWNAERQMSLTMYGEDIGGYPVEKPEFKADFNEEMAGFLPFAHGLDYEDISLTYGDSDVDIIADQQELLNDMTELNIEAVLYTLYPEKTLDPKYSTWANDLNPRPGKVYPIPAGAMIWNNPPAIPTNAFNERLNIKSEIREAVSVSEVNKGVAMTDKTTATEIKAQIGQADQRVTEKAQTLANDFFFLEAKMVEFLSQPLEANGVKQTDNNGNPLTKMFLVQAGALSYDDVFRAVGGDSFKADAVKEELKAAVANEIAAKQSAKSPTSLATDSTQFAKPTTADDEFVAGLFDN